MTVNRLPDYIRHMLGAAELAITYVEGSSRDDFMEDKRTQQAVILNIVILGEAATKVVQSYPDFVVDHPEIPWRNMKGMRNRIAHGYFDIDLDIVWNTVQSALPQLLDQLTAIMRQIDAESRK